MTAAAAAAAALVAPQETITLDYLPRGAAARVFTTRAPEVVLVGAAGTGKSRAALEKVHAALTKYPGARGLMVRQTRRSLTESAMVTYRDKVLHPLDRVTWHSSVQEYQYPNGSMLAVGGLDKPGKVMSSEWDIIYVQEATEIAEEAWEALTTRLRNGRMPYQQLLADCNPGPATHWLRRRMDSGKTQELVSVHEDNPLLWDDDAGGGRWTIEGTRYLGTLDALSGVRYLRLRKGIWASAEGMVYEDAFDRHRNVVPRSAISSHPQTLLGDCGIPRGWPRYLVVDFGYTHPFVARWYAEDGDGRLWMYREIYMTHKLVEDHAQTIRQYAQWSIGGFTGSADPLPRAIICDHDAEDRATLERHLGLHTTAAHKSVSDGIQAVAARFRPAGDGRPRLCYLEDSLVERDRSLVEAKQPTCGVEEIESYVWDVRKEAPVKEHDHAMDCDRYMVAHRDLHAPDIAYGLNIWE